MNSSATIAAAVITAALAAVSGCGSDELSGPPQLRLGRDECHECGMLINEDRCSSAVLVEIDGVHEHVLFDDIGCMLEFERDPDREVRIIDRFVHDHGTREWVAWRTAWFLLADSDSLPTPMGSGMVAFADRAAAHRALLDFGGEVMDHDRLMLVGQTPAGQRPENEVGDAGPAGGSTRP